MRPVFVNPGTGDIGGALLKDAQDNIKAFCRDLGLGPPEIKVTRTPKHDSEGRFAFRLHRGIRRCDVDMPGRPLEEVRYVEGKNAWNFPRLYVDGSSWLWEFAIGFAQRALRDHDGADERAYKTEKSAAERELNVRPRCTVCNTVRVVVEEEIDGRETARVRCYECEPRYFEVTVNRTMYSRWKAKARYMPPEAVGGDADPLCGAHVAGLWATNYCRLRRRHEGRPCEGYFKIVEWIGPA